MTAGEQLQHYLDRFFSLRQHGDDALFLERLRRLQDWQGERLKSTHAHLLDDPVTSTDRLFVRNNGVPPVAVEPANWMLEIDGEAVKWPRRYTLAHLKAKFKSHSYQLTLECGGNGRADPYVAPSHVCIG